MTAPSAADPAIAATRATASGAPAAHGPFRLAVGLVAFTVLVIVMGAMTTSTGSGLAFTDWPMSDGALMPERSYTTVPGFLEHFHRLAAASAGLLSLILTVWLFRSSGARRDQRIVAAIGLLLVSIQGLIGGLHVLNNLPLLSAATHGTLAQISIATFAITAYRLSPRWLRTTPMAHANAGSARVMTVVATAALIVQTILGAIARHSGSEAALWTHAGDALVVFLLVLVAASLAAGKLARVPGVRGLCRWLLGLLVVQIVFGFVALLVRTGKHPENVEHLWRSALISTHVLIGAMLTLVASLLCAHVFRGAIRPAGASRA